MIGAVGAGLLLLLATGLPVAVALFLLAWGVDLAAAFPLIRGLGQVVWSASDSSLLIAIPFFVLLGELLVRAGIAERTYAALDAWLSWAPGGLVHANIGTATCSRPPRAPRSPPPPRSPPSPCRRPSGWATTRGSSRARSPPAARSAS